MAEKIEWLVPPSTAAERTDDLARKCDVIESKVHHYVQMIMAKDCEVDRLRTENAILRQRLKELADELASHDELVAMLNKAKGKMR